MQDLQQPIQATPEVMTLSQEVLPLHQAMTEVQIRHTTEAQARLIIDQPIPITIIQDLLHHHIIEAQVLLTIHPVRQADRLTTIHQLTAHLVE